ncbi:MAG: DUF2238 domain-containing protein [Gammaproteobacteria bacterium]|nr:DUF2238 domain-containing protein [Gammaproteobacteria bacterium]MBU1482568.1 DUF2238 domain-containing protein [Gammaproteobacteria bacterium]
MRYTWTIYVQRPCGQGTICAVGFGLAVSATYELIEWVAVEMMGEGADAFLGTQGYAWDTQSDMFMALIGAVVAQVVLGKVQDKQLVGWVERSDTQQKLRWVSHCSTHPTRADGVDRGDCCAGVVGEGAGQTTRT